MIANTTAWWKAHPSIISEKDEVYVYTDHNGARFKVGDGLAYVVDLPFSEDITMQNVYTPLVTDKSGKVIGKLDAMDLGSLIVTKE